MHERHFTFSSHASGPQSYPHSLIRCFLGDGPYSDMELISGARHKLSLSLSEVERRLGQGHGFFRPDNSILVNGHYALRIATGNRSLLIMTIGRPVRISRRKKRIVKAFLRQKSTGC
ncbi:MAG: LytTR family DNA-binding domain-containing protein [Bacteroidota bacterium]